MGRACPAPTRTIPLTALALVLAALGGCSAIVGAPPGPILCDPLVEGVCPQFHSCICIAEVCSCIPCEPNPETCNGVDDDCDGVEDDGLDADRDGDGAAACEGGMQRDCDDTNPFVFPGNSEVCNGYDDDCDLRTVETGSCLSPGLCGPPIGGGAIRCIDPSNCEDVGCRPGEVCRAGRCETDVVDDCNTMPSLCTALQRCEASTGLCVDVGQLGESCQRDSECQSGRCYLREILGLPDTGRLCSQACCTDTNCPEGFYCAASGTGARGCVMGPRPPSPACARSGDCGASECEIASSYTFQCLGSTDGRAGGTLCGSNDECASGLCDTYCLDACGNVNDCPSAPIWSTGERACRYLGFSSGDTTRWVTVCRYSDRLGFEDYPNATQGMTCGSDNDCRDGFCSAGRCADACCNDDQCPESHLCAPVDHLGWEMRCLPRAR